MIVDSYEDTESLTRIEATLWVDRDSQKAIVIGKGGSLLKRISTDARQDLERNLGRKVYLRLWVKTKKGWTDSSDALQSIGLTE